ncbi:MAG: prepilin-type N-terminal cleavage/methylation domain-containing protein [Deltaproteobacteria bacterium]|nr:prepilin-type N-terminal cleavage/methylation domain-containing protein [Candidatus Anaeroferrophillus wilburensis]MBN2888367.1 prepilin-type N-terminal cleavage/methylation domain-containing protein [Deltaproteobacteria bacterium]
MNKRGFTLLEMLVAVLVVSLTVTVFFQVLSASMKLEQKGRRLDELQLVAGQLFDLLLAHDVREETFPWQGEVEGLPWKLTLFPIDVRDKDSVAAEEIAVRLPEELYRFILQVSYGARGTALLTLTREMRFPLTYFDDAFREEHLTPLENPAGS